MSAFSAMIVNSLIFASMAWAGMDDALPDVNPAPPAIAVTLEALPRKGFEKPPEALPRIHNEPEPVAPEVDAINLARKKAEEEEEAKKKKADKKKRELANEKRRIEDEKQRKLAQKRKDQRERESRRKAMAKSLKKFDSRGDDEDAPGFADGFAEGTSSTLTVAQNAYVSLVSTVLQRQFEIPAVVPVDERKRLEAHVHLRVNTHGKLVGEPKLVKSSKNRFFDQAALATAKRFNKSSALKIPLPPKSNAPLRKLVLTQGITARMKAR
jgi:outer membrane biosynthesis protein TonB